MSHVKLEGLTKSFRNIEVLKNINLEIKEGEIISLLGESGCGKSTTLKVIAGILTPENGDILFDGESVKHLPTGKRDAAIVFQDYLLFPHMNVFENIEFGLKMKKIKKDLRYKKVKELIELVKLDKYESKYPFELSGGQQQRVAIARTLAINPKVLLLDEPFSNLDINLRNEMREFVLELQKKLKITTVLVTHDKEEALIMSDRIAVMVDGEIVQYDTPKNLYEKPNSKSVANIFGERNYILGKIKNNRFISNIIEINLEDSEIYSQNEDFIEVMIPKESIYIGDKGLQGRIIKRKYAGENTYYEIELGNQTLKCSSCNHDYNVGDCVKVSIDNSKLVYFKNNRVI